jgi:hypothetical protein
MNCPYCKETCEKDTDFYRCYDCCATYHRDLLTGKLTTTCLYIIYQNKMYYLKLAHNSGTARVYWVHSKDDTYLHQHRPISEEVVVWMDTIPEGVTPQNLEQKIKFFMTFS